MPHRPQLHAHALIADKAFYVGTLVKPVPLSDPGSVFCGLTHRFSSFIRVLPPIPSVFAGGAGGTLSLKIQLLLDPRLHLHKLLDPLLLHVSLHDELRHGHYGRAPLPGLPVPWLLHVSLHDELRHGHYGRAPLPGLPVPWLLNTQASSIV